MSVSVLTECNLDGVLLAKLLVDEQERGEAVVKVIERLTTGYSVARTILAVKRTPVAVVIDADSPETRAAEDRKYRVEEVIGDAAGGVPFRVIVAVPELAILFFERPDLIRRVFGELSEHRAELAQLSPRRAIAKLSNGEPFDTSRVRLLRAMDDSDIKALRETELVRDLLDFIAGQVDYAKHGTVSKGSLA